MSPYWSDAAKFALHGLGIIVVTVLAACLIAAVVELCNREL